MAINMEECPIVRGPGKVRPRVGRELSKAIGPELGLEPRPLVVGPSYGTTAEEEA